MANETDAARQSELFRNYLRTSAAFWDYSWHNQMLIWRQRPDASFVGCFHTWLKCGRYVRRGERGIAILAPMFVKDKRQTPDGSEAESQHIWCKVVYVFDLSQTDGTALPELPTKSGLSMICKRTKRSTAKHVTKGYVGRTNIMAVIARCGADT